MANGYITAGDGAVGVDSATECTRALYAFRIPLQPTHWAGSGTLTKRFRFQPSFQFTVGAGDTIEIEGESYTAGTALWSENGNDKTVVTNDVAACAAITGADTRPKMCIGGYEAKSKATRTSEMLSVGVELVTNTAWGAGDPVLSDDVEIISRVSTWKPYAAQRPVSSWLMRKIIAGSLNKCAYENRQVWSVPL